MAETSVIIVEYESGAALGRCLDSLEHNGTAGLEAVVVNNGSESEEVARAGERSFVKLVSPGENVGFAAGCNLGAEHASGDVLLFLNPDTVVAPGAVQALAAALGDTSVGIATARLRLLSQPELLNSAGNVLHVTGLAWAGSFGRPADEVSDSREVAYPSGAAMAIRAELFSELGGFTDELFMYQEDLELAWRARLRGLRIVVVPAADVYHDYDFGRNPRKQYFLERNRLVFVLSAYSPRLLLLLAPLLLATEVGMLALAGKDGWARDKLAGWGWCLRQAGWLRRRRRKTQALRRVADRDLAPLLTPVIDPAMIQVPVLVRAVNPLLERYWSLVRRAL